jgi:Zn ribbon nucleic-acid-binding protein
MAMVGATMVCPKCLKSKMDFYNSTRTYSCVRCGFVMDEHMEKLKVVPQRLKYSQFQPLQEYNPQGMQYEKPGPYTEEQLRQAVVELEKIRKNLEQREYEEKKYEVYTFVGEWLTQLPPSPEPQTHVEYIGGPLDKYREPVESLGGPQFKGHISSYFGLAFRSIL